MPRATVEHYRHASYRLERFTFEGGRKSWAFPVGVAVEWTHCHFGGVRPWLVCPRCGHRRLRLYFLRDIGTLCRGCLGLAYRSQQVPPMRRVQIRQERLRARLGGFGEPGEAFPEKPPRMHWRTYERLQCLHEQLEEKVDEIWAPRCSALVSAMRRRQLR